LGELHVKEGLDALQLLALLSQLSNFVQLDSQELTELVVLDVQLLEFASELLIATNWLVQDARDESVDQLRDDALLLVQASVVESHCDLNNVQWLEQRRECGSGGVVVVVILTTEQDALFWLLLLLLLLNNELGVVLNECVQLVDLLLQQIVILWLVLALVLVLVLLSLGGVKTFNLDVLVALANVLLQLSQHFQVVLQHLLHFPLLLLLLNWV